MVVSFSFDWDQIKRGPWCYSGWIGSRFALALVNTWSMENSTIMYCTKMEMPRWAFCVRRTKGKNPHNIKEKFIDKSKSKKEQLTNPCLAGLTCKRYSSLGRSSIRGINLGRQHETKRDCLRKATWWKLASLLQRWKLKGQLAYPCHLALVSVPYVLVLLTSCILHYLQTLNCELAARPSAADSNSDYFAAS